jgi:hypothetical protein
VATIGGGESNSAAGLRAIVAGGFTNRATDDYATVGGGNNNQAGNNAGTTADRPYTTVAGGQSNTASGAYATVGGGTGNQATHSYASVDGGQSNKATQTYASVGGGQANTASNAYTTIGGGRSNTASGAYASVSGGYSNTATLSYASIAGGFDNLASGQYATVAGGLSNRAQGTTSFAAGRRARAIHAGAFVWGDSTNANVASTGNNQFIVRAAGGIWLGTNSTVSLPAGRFLNTSTGAYLSSGGAWTNSSDRNVKANVAAVDSASILERVAAMPIQLWNYKSQDASVKHIGPMAQDFAAAFGVGENDTTISTVDADGVALAAIQGLNQKVEAVTAENSRLKERLAAVEAVQGEGSAPLQVMSAGLTLSWSMVVLGLAFLIALLIISSVSLTLLFLRRRAPAA